MGLKYRGKSIESFNGWRLIKELSRQEIGGEMYWDDVH